MTPQTLPLFDDEPPAAYSLVAVLAQSKPATKAQIAFQRLVVKIETKREELARWQAFALRYQQRVASEVMPLQSKLKDGQRQMVLLIDDLLSRPPPGRRFGKGQRAKVQRVLMNLLAGLLDGEPDTELDALYEKHAGVSHAEGRRSELAVAQAMLEDMFGVDIGDAHGAKSAEELLAHAHAKLRERVETESRVGEATQAARDAARPAATRAKADAAKARQGAAAEEASRSIREVYRKLASALHPDREPDAAEQKRKTRLMQRVNDAYAAKDLLTLLGLQLEIEQIDAKHLAAVSPQRLAHFTQVLREQLADLEAELRECVVPFQLNAPPSRSITPASVDHQLNAEIADLKATLRQLGNDLVAYRDPARLIDDLKYLPLEADADDGAFFDVFTASSMEAAPKPRRKRR